MAFDPGINKSQDGRPPSASSHPSLPDVSRPPLAEWTPLERDGVQWEGQVLIAGAGTHLPARLILTRSRLVLATQSAIALDVPRTWLRPQPMLLDGNAVRLSVTPEETQASSRGSERLVIRTRGGRGAATQLIRAITGRMASSRAPERHVPSQAAEVPTWSERVGAALPVALPPLPDFDDGDGEKRPWPPIEQHALPPAQPRREASAAARPTHDRTRRDPEDAAWRTPARRGVAAGALAGTAMVPGNGPHASRLRPGHGGSSAEAADEAPTFVAEEPHQFNRALVWGLRTLILAILVGTGVYFGGDRFALPANLDLNLPANLESRLGFDQDDPDTDQIAADLGQTGANGSEGGAEDAGDAARSERRSDGTSGAPNGGVIQQGADQDENSAVGGTTSVLPSTEQRTEQRTDDDVATEEPAPTDVPEPTDVPGETGGTGGVTGDEDIPADEQSAPTEAPGDAVPADDPIIEPTAIPTQEPTAVPTQEPTAVPTEEPTAVPTQEPTAVPTQEPTAVPTQEPTAVPTEEPTAVPTEEPTAVPTEEPTAVPTEEPTAVPTAVPTQEPTAEPTLESQPPSVDPQTPPAQSVASGPFRFSIEGAAVGDTIEDLPELSDVGSYGEWVVLSLYGENWSDSEQVFDMSQFTLLADGEEIPLDVGNSWIASQLGFTPAYGNTDSILWAAGERHAFALTFLIPPGTETLELRAGDQVIDLGAALENPDSLAQESDAAAEPQYTEAKVVEVVDGETIIIEKEGIRQEVRYLGIDAPTGDDCYAGEATAANAGLVSGKTVRIERQATDVDAQGNWVRDVWVEAEDGRFLLVAEALVAEGAAEANITEPNTRFAGWLTASQSDAREEGKGLWGVCEPEAASRSRETEAMITPLDRLTAQRKRDR